MNSKERLADAVFESIGAMMSAYAEEAVRVAWKDHRQHLNLGAASIDTLETILSGQAPEDLEFQTRLWGGYFGEVLRRQFGGEWEFAQYPGRIAAVPALSIGGSKLYPLMKVYRRLTLGEAENLPLFYQMVAERLAKEQVPSRNPKRPAERTTDGQNGVS